MATQAIFQDDPNAIEKLEKRLEMLIAEKAKWKGIKKCKPRTFDGSLEDRAWYEPQSIQTKIRETKKKIEKIKERQQSGKKLVRKPTYKDGARRFYYEEVDDEDKPTEGSA